MFRKLMLIVTALAVFCFLTPGDGLAQFNNQVGLYADPNDLTSTSLNVASPQPVNLYLVLANPYRERAGQSVASVSGFECRVVIPAGDSILGFTPATAAVDLARYPEIVVGFGTPLPVSGGKVLLGTLAVMTQAAPASFFYLEKVVFPSLVEEDSMAFAARVDETEEILAMHPASGGFDEPVFAINGSVVAAVGETWGGLKSLYR